MEEELVVEHMQVERVIHLRLEQTDGHQQLKYLVKVCICARSLDIQLVCPLSSSLQQLKHLIEMCVQQLPQQAVSKQSQPADLHVSCTAWEGLNLLSQMQKQSGWPYSITCSRHSRHSSLDWHSRLTGNKSAAQLPAASQVPCLYACNSLLQHTGNMAEYRHWHLRPAVTNREWLVISL